MNFKPLTGWVDSMFSEIIRKHIKEKLSSGSGETIVTLIDKKRSEALKEQKHKYLTIKAVEEEGVQSFDVLIGAD